MSQHGSSDTAKDENGLRKILLMRGAACGMPEGDCWSEGEYYWCREPENKSATDALWRHRLLLRAREVEFCYGGICPTQSAAGVRDEDHLQARGLSSRIVVNALAQQLDHIDFLD
jgi:hypothetical protein